VDVRLYEAGAPSVEVSVDKFLARLLEFVAERNPEDFVFLDGKLLKPRQLGLQDLEES
jgi:hypothetical protein